MGSVGKSINSALQLALVKTQCPLYNTMMIIIEVVRVNTFDMQKDAARGYGTAPIIFSSLSYLIISKQDQFETG